MILSQQEIDNVHYLAGPMTGIPEYNYPYFEKVATRLRAFGLKIESPHENPWPVCLLTGDKDETCGGSCEYCNPETHEAYKWAEMMRLGAEQMGRCNSIILLKGWPRSRGARRELNTALTAEWPVYYYLDPPGRMIYMSGPEF